MIYSIILFILTFSIIYTSIQYKKNIIKFFKGNFFKEKRKILFVNLLIIFVILFSYTWGSSQIATYLRYNPKIIGKPIYGNIYSPFLILKLALVKGINKNVIIATIMTKTGILMNLGAFFIFLLMILDFKKRGEDSHGTARWAKEKEWEEKGYLCETEKYKDGVILGRTKPPLIGKAKTIIDNEKTHIAVVAPTRSGKGVGIIIPTLLNWRESTFVFDMKGENFALTSGYRKKELKNTILKFQPYSFDDSISYNPLAEVRIGTIYEVKDATIIADIMTDPGEGKKRDHWDNSASSLLVGLILYVLYKAENEGRKGSLGDIVDFLTDTSKPLDERWEDLIKYPTSNNNIYIRAWKTIYSKQERGDLPQNVHPKVARTSAEMLNKDVRERASIISSVMAKMTLFKDPVIRKNSTNVDFRIGDLMDHEKPVSFYVVVEAEAMETLAPLLRLLVTQIIGVLAPEMDFENDKPPHKHRLLLMLDEFPAFGTIPLLEKALAYIAGYGMKAVIIAQALSQISKNYGKENSVFDNCATAVFYAPTPLDKDTPDRISALLGETTIRVTNKSWKAMSFGQNNLSQSNQARKLLTPEEVRNKLGDKRNIISIAGMYPYMGYKIRFYEETYFTSKTNKKYGIPKSEKILQKK